MVDETTCNRFGVDVHGVPTLCSGECFCTAERPFQTGVSVDTSERLLSTPGDFVNTAGRSQTHDVSAAGYPPSKGGEKCYGGFVTRGLDRSTALGEDCWRGVWEDYLTGSLDGVIGRRQWAYAVETTVEPTVDYCRTYGRPCVTSSRCGTAGYIFVDHLMYRTWARRNGRRIFDQTKIV